MTFDLICAGVVVLFGVLGLIRGLVRQIFGIAGFVGGIVLARMFATPLAEETHAWLGISTAIAAVLAGFLIFFAVEVTAKVLGYFLTAALGTFTGTINRVGGLALGVIKGGLLAWAMASLMALAQPKLKSLEKRSPMIARLDLEHSEAIALTKNSSALGDKANQLRKQAEKRLHAQKH